MNIRTYNAGDRKACIEIFKSNTPFFFDPSEQTGFEKWLDGKDAGIQSYESNGDEQFWIAEFENKVIACAGYYLPENELRGNMVWGMVHKEYHKHGIGRKMLLFRIRQLESNYPGCTISLDTTQHTYRFFEKMGFKVVSVRKEFYGKGLDRYDMIRIRPVQFELV